MKKSFLIIATVVLTMFNVNATTNLQNEPLKNVNPKYTAVKVYDWKIELEDGIFSGTSLSKKKAEKTLSILSKGEFVLHKQIVSYYVLQSEANYSNYRTYYWEAQYENGQAKGFASSKEKAKKLIKLVAEGDILTFKIIKSKK